MILHHFLLVTIMAIGTHLPCFYGWKQWTWQGDFDPGVRQGHSMNLLNSKVVIFGGRATDNTREHIPKTYEIQKVNGRFEFTTYTDKPIVEETCTEELAASGTCEIPSKHIPVGVFYNDIWSYDINCTRYADDGCIGGQWRQWDVGAVDGGCKIIYGAEICSHPSERWYHASAVFPDDTMLIYGGFSQRCSDYCDDMWSYNFSDRSWSEIAEIGNTNFGPGKRWKSSAVTDGFTMYVYGGFRIWHGFSPLNSDENNWEDLSVYPNGGYLSDLWVYNRTNLSWTSIQAKRECYSVEKIEWDNRNDFECTTYWPPPRAGHVSVLFKDALFIHGGYTTFFPYPSTTGPGFGRGTLASGLPGFTPFPSHPYYLSDMWKFNITTGLWSEIKALGGIKPPPRTDHVMLSAGLVFILFGGYKANYYFDDTWHYNTTANQWLQQEYFVHAKYPAACTDDLQHRKAPHSGEYYPWEVPSDIPEEDGFTFIAERHYGTRVFSVKAQPTRGLDLPQDQQVFVQQARRQAPGWDGCRDRADGRNDLPQELQWVKPSQRASLSAVYHPGFQLVLIYGGIGYDEESPFEVDKSNDVSTLGELWQYSLANCPKNCSVNGICEYGKCLCHDGYYGIDCSNSSCPGSLCTFDELSKTQSCNHCCFSGFEHTEDDSYVPNVQKLPCTKEDSGYQNGVCDGFGHCICRPPFVGDDCSIRDCFNNCSGHGFCSIEFPNSRCMCDIGWIGKYCDTRVCLNNCSYPNGVCLNGTCWCDMIYEPYNNTIAYFPFMGEDCSFVLPFAGAVSVYQLLYGWIFVVFLVTLLMMI